MKMKYGIYLALSIGITEVRSIERYMFADALIFTCTVLFYVAPVQTVVIMPIYENRASVIAYI